MLSRGKPILFQFLIILAVVVALLASGGQTLNAQQRPAPRTVTVLVGGGQDTTVLDGFFPQNLRVRVGDTVAWKFNGDQTHHRHTAHFHGGPFAGPKVALPGGGPGEFTPQRNIPLPGSTKGEVMRNPLILFPTRQPGAPVETYDGTTFISSGELSKRPRKGTARNENFSLTFIKPGIYSYVCMNHWSHMVGTIEVVSATGTDVPDQAQIDKQAKAEMDSLLAAIEKAKEQGKAVRSQPGPNGTTLWFVRTGALLAGDMRGMTFDYVPKNLTVKAGDTVIWEAIDNHTITFVPSPPAPEPLIAKPQAEGHPVFIVNQQVQRPANPSGTYDPSQYYNSGNIGMRSPQNTASWAMTFDKPGVYEYICAFHHEMGMKGAITVVAR